MKKWTIVSSPLHDKKLHQTIFVLLKPNRKSDDFAPQVVQKELKKVFTLL
jgi:hypothetical protein